VPGNHEPIGIRVQLPYPGTFMLPEAFAHNEPSRCLDGEPGVGTGVAGKGAAAEGKR
jgi:hypothetical protein